MKFKLSGILVKIAFADQVPVLLKRDQPNRPAARFNRIGENALYLSVDETSARIAMQKYARPSDPPRVLIRYAIEPCQLVDLRHPDAAEWRDLARNDWHSELANNIEPSSWQVADALRQAGEVGLIDPSRKNPSRWHVTLLRWNEIGVPTVKMIGNPTPIKLP